jgi:hypothetical protein
MAETGIFDAHNRDLLMGTVFTPRRWAEFAVAETGLFQKWIDGATIFDPTMGEGNLLSALITYGMVKGFGVRELPWHRLYGNELNTRLYERAVERFRIAYGLNMTANFSNEDILTLPRRSYDIVFANPPWQNFVDLPPDYKEAVKPYFLSLGLVADSRELLLGGSRIDIAALVLQVVLQDFLREGGELVAFFPLSLLLNDGAHRQFRNFGIGDLRFSLRQVWDFAGQDIYGGVTTRHGLLHIVRDQPTVFPLPYHQWQEAGWKQGYAMPMLDPTAPFSIFDHPPGPDELAITPIRLPKASVPRQGINTGGANALFFFDRLTDSGDGLVKVGNPHGPDVELPHALLHPLITSANFKNADDTPRKWVLLPYTASGKVMDAAQVAAHPTLSAYLATHLAALQGRKGLLIQNMVARGHWWGLLGVGPYCFFPYKVVWEAYGRGEFRPQIFDARWQVNQSLQAYIPVHSLAEAERVLQALQQPNVEAYLRSLKMEGTMNWAQPGKIKRLIRFEEESR